MAMVDYPFIKSDRPILSHTLPHSTQTDILIYYKQYILLQFGTKNEAPSKTQNHS